MTAPTMFAGQYAQRIRTLWIAIWILAVTFVTLTAMVGYLGYRIGEMPGGIAPIQDSEVLGVCVDTDYQSGSVTVSSPIRINGVVSCRSGEFTPVAPVEIGATGGA